MKNGGKEENNLIISRIFQFMFQEMQKKKKDHNLLLQIKRLTQDQNSEIDKNQKF